MQNSEVRMQNLKSSLGGTSEVLCLTRLFVTAVCYSISAMYSDFHALDRWTKKQVHCLYQALIVAVATRHADAVDIKFLVDGRPVWVVLPLPAWEAYKQQ